MQYPIGALFLFHFVSAPHERIDRLQQKVNRLLQLIESEKPIPVSKDIFELVRNWSRCWCDEINYFIGGNFYIHVGELKLKIVNI